MKVGDLDFFWCAYPQVVGRRQFGVRRPVCFVFQYWHRRVGGLGQSGLLNEPQTLNPKPYEP